MPEANMFMEKRVYPRISVKLPVKFRLADNKAELQSIEEWRKTERHSEGMDMSLGGMYVVLDKKILVGSLLCFDLDLPNIPKHLTGYAEAVWANEMGAGLRFLMIENDDLEGLKDFLDKASTK